MHSIAAHFKLWLHCLEASVASKIYYCYGQWLFPHIVGYCAASPTDLEHVTYRVKCEPDRSWYEFSDQLQIFSVTLQMWSLLQEHIKRSCKLCLTWDWRLVSSVLFHGHHTTQCFCLQREIFHYLLTFMKVSLFSQQDHNVRKFLQRFCLHSNTGI